MLIWYGNIPEETIWFFHRQQGIWVWVSIGLIFLHWMLPFAGTMSRHVRRNPALVCFWAAYLLVMHFVDVYWMIMPQSVGDWGECPSGVGGWLGGRRGKLAVRARHGRIADRLRASPCPTERRRRCKGPTTR